MKGESCRSARAARSRDCQREICPALSAPRWKANSGRCGHASVGGVPICAHERRGPSCSPALPPKQAAARSGNAVKIHKKAAFDRKAAFLCSYRWRFEVLPRWIGAAVRWGRIALGRACSLSNAGRFDDPLCTRSPCRDRLRGMDPALCTLHWKGISIRCRRSAARARGPGLQIQNRAWVCPCDAPPNWSAPPGR